jgi:hypothetical protein
MQPGVPFISHSTRCMRVGSLMLWRLQRVLPGMSAFCQVVVHCALSQQRGPRSAAAASGLPPTATSAVTEHITCLASCYLQHLLFALPAAPLPPPLFAAFQVVVP